MKIKVRKKSIFCRIAYFKQEKPSNGNICEDCKRFAKNSIGYFLTALLVCIAAIVVSIVDLFGILIKGESLWYRLYLERIKKVKVDDDYLPLPYGTYRGKSVPGMISLAILSFLEVKKAIQLISKIPVEKKMAFKMSLLEFFRNFLISLWKESKEIFFSKELIYGGMIFLAAFLLMTLWIYAIRKKWFMTLKKEFTDLKTISKSLLQSIKDHTCIQIEYTDD